MSRISGCGILLAALLPLMLAAGCNRDVQAANSSQPSHALSVKVMTVDLQRVPEFTEYISTLRSRTASILQPQVEGQIVRIYVTSGARVAAGTPILEIDPLKQQATVHNQEASRDSKLATLEYNRRELERSKALWEAGVIARQNLDQAQSLYDSSKADVTALDANIREQSVQLHYYTVKAPTSGTVGDIPVRVGDRVTVQTVLTTLDQGNQLEAYISVPAEKSSSLRLGMPVDILDSEGKPAGRANITFISPRVDSDTQLLLIKALILNQQHRLRNDQVVHVRVIWNESELPVVPLTAVTRLNGQMFVFVTDSKNGQTVARQRVIRVGDLVGNDYVVLDGVKPGEQLITSGVQILVDGMPVSPQS